MPSLRGSNYCKKRCHPNDNCSRFNNPPEKKSVEAAKAWINKHCWKRKTTNWIRSSYRLKHDVEHETGIYIRNGEFIKAAMLLGYKVDGISYPNCYFNMGIKTKRNKQYWQNQG